MTGERRFELDWPESAPTQSREQGVAIDDIRTVLRSAPVANGRALLMELQRIPTDDFAVSEREVVVQQLANTLSAVSIDRVDGQFVRSLLRTALRFRDAEQPIMDAMADSLIALLEHPNIQLVQASTAAVVRLGDAPNFAEQFADHFETFLALCSRPEPELATPASRCIQTIARDCPAATLDHVASLRRCLSAEGATSPGPLWYALWSAAAQSPGMFSAVVERLTNTGSEDSIDPILGQMGAAFEEYATLEPGRASQALANYEDALEDGGSSWSLVLFAENVLQHESVFEGETADQARSALDAYFSVVREDDHISGSAPAWGWLRANDDPEPLLPYVDVLVNSIVEGTPVYAVPSLLLCVEADPSILEPHVETLLEAGRLTEDPHVAAGCIALVTKFAGRDGTDMTIPFLSPEELSDLLDVCFDADRTNAFPGTKAAHATFVRGCLRHAHHDSFRGDVASLVTEIVRRICRDSVETIPNELLVALSDVFEHANAETVRAVTPRVIEYASRLSDPDVRRGFIPMVCLHVQDRPDVEFDSRVYQSLSDVYHRLPSEHEWTAPARQRVPPLKIHVEEGSRLPAPRSTILDTLQTICEDGQQTPRLPLGVAAEALGSTNTPERYRGHQLLRTVLELIEGNPSEWFVERTTERDRRYSARCLCAELEQADDRSFMVAAITLELLREADAQAVAGYADRILRALRLPRGDEPPVDEAQLTEFRQLVPELVSGLRPAASDETVAATLTYFARHSHGVLRLACVWLLDQTNVLSERIAARRDQRSTDVAAACLSELLKATRRPVDPEPIRTEIFEWELRDFPPRAHRAPRSAFEELVCRIVVDVLDENPHAFPDDVQRLTPLWHSSDPDVRAAVARIAKRVATHSPETARGWKPELQALTTDSVPVQSASIETLSVMGDAAELTLD